MFIGEDLRSLKAILSAKTCFLSIGLALIGCASVRTRSGGQREFPVIEIPESAIRCISDTAEVESPALSPDGRRVAVQVLDYRHRWLPYEVCSIAVSKLDDADRWSPLSVVRSGLHKPYVGRMELPVQPSFDETGEDLLLTHIQFFSGMGIPWLHTTRSWVERLPWVGGGGSRLVEHGDWDMRATELLQHARISPDGAWLTLYTREHARDQGVHLLNLRSGARHRLSRQNDKHPTWDPTGRRIYFHHVEGGRRRRFDLFPRGTERSVLGFFELQIEDGHLVGWKRRLMEEMGDEFVYHKHPTEVAGTGLLFFHGRLKPDGKMKLMVRTADPGSQVYVVKPRWNGQALKAAKHACSSFHSVYLVFIGKIKGEKDYRLLLSLTPEAISLIRAAVRAGSN